VLSLTMLAASDTKLKVHTVVQQTPEAENVAVARSIHVSQDSPWVYV
jgi:hypothetical protein